MLKLVLIGYLDKMHNNKTYLGISRILFRWSFRALMLLFLHMGRQAVERLILCLVKALIRIYQGKDNIWISYLAAIRRVALKDKIPLLVWTMSIPPKRGALFQELSPHFFKD